MLSPKFPKPLVVNGRHYYSRGELRRWRAAAAGEPTPEPRADDEFWMTSRAAREFLGGVSTMWLHRRRKRPASESSPNNESEGR
jgi:hypothetical protein